MKVRKKLLLMAMLAMVLVVAGSALAQVASDPTTDGATPTEETTPVAPDSATPVPAPATAPAPTFALGADGDTLTQDGELAGSCAAIFRQEQAELSLQPYPTYVSDAARACENLGAVNPFPFPYFYDTEGFFYTYDPVSDAYYTEFDEASGLIYLYDLVTDAFYSYDPGTGVYAPA